MATISDSIASHVRDRISRTAIGMLVEGARRSSVFRDRILAKVSSALGRSYRDNYNSEDHAEFLAHGIWFGRSLKPFLVRLLQERPRAAKRLVHLAYVWARDMRRRNKAQTSGVAAPVTVALEPTGRCNLRCPGCYANSGPTGTDLPYEVWRDVVAEVRDMGVTLITLTGGEPFLRESEDRIITRLAAEFPNLGFLVYTNATMIDDEVARRLGEVGNVFPGISIEGRAPESDARRGAGYARQASQVRQRLARQEVMYGFSATVTRKNAHIVASDEFLDTRLAEGDMFGWYFLLQPIGRNPDVNLLVTAEQRAFLREQIYKWRHEGRPIFLGDFWNDGILTGGCIAGGTSYFHIYANGDISPCVFAPVACANILDIRAGRSPYRSLADVVNRHPVFVRFREKQAEITDYRAPCPLLDHPKKFREICAHTDWFAGNNMPAGYLDGDIARALDAGAREWQEALQRMPHVPECVEPELAALRKELSARLKAQAREVAASH